MSERQSCCEERLPLSLCLSLGGRFLSERSFDEAMDAFGTAHRYLSAIPSQTKNSGSFAEPKARNEREEQELHRETSILSSTIPSASTPLTHVDTYHGEECDAGPRAFNEAIVPDNATGLDSNLLRLIISYNQALVCHATKEYSQARQLYRFVASTILTTDRSVFGNNADATLSHLAMRAHNNMGQIDYNERNEECACFHFETAIAYVPSGARGLADDASSKATTTTISPVHQLEIATVLSNWCRTRWTTGQVDEAVFFALEDIVRIRSLHLGSDHPDVAAAHFNLGIAESLRQPSDPKANAHLIQYMRISFDRFRRKQNGDDNENTKNDVVGDEDGDAIDNADDVELEPFKGLAYVLWIQNEGKDDEISRSIVRGLLAFRDKRRDLGYVHPEVASVLNFVGTLLFRRRELDCALCFFSQELRIEERLRSLAAAQAGKSSSSAASWCDDISVSVTCNNIGRILLELGRYTEAKYFFERSLGSAIDGECDGGNNNNNPAAGNNRAVLSDDSASTSENGPEKRKRADDDDEVEEEDADSPPGIPSSTLNLHSTVWYNLGLIHDKTGAHMEAIRAFRMSLKLRRAMLGREQSDIACLLYNIGVLQMEQNLLDEATESFQEALAHRRVAGKGRLNDHYVVKTLKKLSSMYKSEGKLDGAIRVYKDSLSILTTSNDFEDTDRNRKTAVVLRDIAELYQARGDLNSALEYARNSVDLFRTIRATDSTTAMDVDGTAEEDRHFVEEDANALLLVGSLQYERCDPLRAQVSFAEAFHVVHSALISISSSATSTATDAKLAATLLPLLEVSATLRSAQCAPEA